MTTRTFTGRFFFTPTSLVSSLRPPSGHLDRSQPSTSAHRDSTGRTAHAHSPAPLDMPAHVHPLPHQIKPRRGIPTCRIKPARQAASSHVRTPRPLATFLPQPGLVSPPLARPHRPTLPSRATSFDHPGQPHVLTSSRLSTSTPLALPRHFQPARNLTASTCLGRPCPVSSSLSAPPSTTLKGNTSD